MGSQSGPIVYISHKFTSSLDSNNKAASSDCVVYPYVCLIKGMVKYPLHYSTYVAATTPGTSLLNLTTITDSYDDWSEK